jgi:hypothetical protein
MNEDELRVEITRITYDYVRWLLVCLPALLFVVTTLTALQQGELESPSVRTTGGLSGTFSSAPSSRSLLAWSRTRAWVCWRTMR